MAQQKVEIPIPDDLTPRQRLELADLVIEHIVERTQNGKDKNGKKFPAYSKAYVESLDFKNAGKSKNVVDLQLSGDMLAALELIRADRGKLVIGYKRGSEENGKAEGNILGSYGGEPDKKKARDFLGLERAKLKELIAAVVGGSDDG